MQLYKQFLFGFLSLEAVLALPWEGPKPTQVIEVGSLELLKRQGNAVPEIAGRSPAEEDALLQRAVTSSAATFSLSSSAAAATTSFSFSSNTCGYLWGSAVSPQVCSFGYTCAIATQQSVWACLTESPGAQISTTCIPQVSVASCANNKACYANPYIEQCDVLNPYCNQQILSGEGDGDATLFYCDSSATLQTIYATATDSAVPVGSFNFIQMTIPNFSSSSSIPSTTTPQTTTSPIPAVPTTTPPGPSIGILTSPTPPPTPTPASGKSTPIGAIVGGAVGGVAVIAAVIFGIWFFCIRKKNSSSNPAPAPNPDPRFNQVQSPPPTFAAGGVADASPKTGAHSSVAYYPPPPPTNEKEIFLPGQNSPQSPESQFSQFGNQPSHGNTNSFVAYSPPISPAPGYEQHQPVLYPQHPPGSELDGTGVHRS